MFDQTFNKRGLAGQLKQGETPKPYSSMDKLLDESLKIVKGGFSEDPSFVFSKIKGRIICRLEKLEEELVARKASKNIQRLTNVKQSNRAKIVSNLAKLLEENVDCRVYRLDIVRFYENVDVNLLIKQFKEDLGVSRVTVRLLESLFQSLEKKGIKGLPQGMSISAILAERTLRDFDRNVEQLNEVFFYSRYVDDIIIITSGLESDDFDNIIQKFLPGKLRISTKRNKKKILDMNFQKKSYEEVLGSVDYLGYNFEIRNPKKNCTKRIVNIDISESKIKKIKTKCALSLKDFTRNKNYTLLIKRIKLITSNYVIYEPSTGSDRLTGIYYNSLLSR